MNSTKSDNDYSLPLEPPIAEPRHYSREMVFGMLTTPIMADHHNLNDSVEAHEHSFIEVSLVAAGNGQHLTIAGTRPISAGDVIVVHPGQWHAYVGCEHLIVRNCCFGAELLEAELAWLKQEPGVSTLISTVRSPEPLVQRLPTTAVPNCLVHLDALVPQVAEGSPRNKTKVRTRPELVGHLLLLLSEIGHHVDQDTALGKTMHPAVKKLLRLLNSNIAHPWTLNELTSACGDIDETYLIRLFRQETGETPIAHLARLRASRAAARLLRYPHEPIAQVGAAVGWFDANYFARRFRQFYKQSPRQFRNLAGYR